MRQPSANSCTRRCRGGSDDHFDCTGFSRRTVIAILAVVVASILVLGACTDGGTNGAASESNVGGRNSIVTELKRLWIGPTVVDCEGVVPQQCLLIAESDGG